MIIVKNRGNSIRIVHRGRTYNINAGSRRGFTGASGMFTTADLKTVTVTNGLITSIV